MKKIILLIIIGLSFYIGLQQPARAESSHITVHSNGDWQNPAIMTGVKLPIASFTILAESPSVAWRQISIHVLLSNGLTASNWILQDNSNTAYTSDVTAVQNGGVITFTTPVELPLYNNTAGVGYSVYATITGDVTSAPPTIITKFIDSSDFVLNGSYIINGLPTTPQTRGNVCTSWTYSNWSACSNAGKQTRMIASSSPSECVGGNPMISQSCKQLLPKIISVSPNTINRGDTIEIVGENFGDGHNNNSRVLISGSAEAQTVVSWSNTKIRSKINNIDEFLKSEKENLDLKGFSATTIALSIKCETSCGSGKIADGVTSDGVDYIIGPSPLIKILKPVPSCTVDTWSCGIWNSCSIDEKQTRSCAKKSICEGGVVSPSTTQSCTYIAPTCSSWTYSNWTSCSIDGKQTRSVATSFPLSCVGGNPIISQSCTPPPPMCDEDKWKCSDWDTCTLSGRQYRGCIKSFDCPNADTPSPNQAQSCTAPRPPCTEDKWECGNWGQCSLDGVQRRSCRRTFNCADAESDVPDTSRSCDPQSTSISQPRSQQTAVEDMVDRDLIFKTTVKLYCPYPTKGTGGPQGSGTVIDQYGTILTNRHVIEGTIGTCYVGFISEQDDIPEFYQDIVADVKQSSSDKWPAGDMALLKIRNPNRIYSAVDIFKGNSDNLRQGDTILPFGYPDSEIWGDTITYTEGAYNGKGTTVTFTKKNCKTVDRNYTLDVRRYFKTTAPIDHGNSGGGAYQKKTGFFVGIPSLGTSCDEKVPSRVNYILSVNAIKNWLNSLGRNYSVSKNNFTNLGNYYSSPISIEQLPLSNVKNENSDEPSISIYKDKSKRVLIASKNGIYNVPAPTFLINADLLNQGYYVYFGLNKKTDPLKKGRYIGLKEFTPKRIIKSGTYYFIFKTKGENGKIGAAVVTEYRYKK